MTDRNEKWVVSSRRNAYPTTPTVAIPYIGNDVVLEDYSFPPNSQFSRGVTNVVFKRVRFNGPSISRTTLFGLIQLRMVISCSQFIETDFGALAAYGVDFLDCNFDSCVFGEMNLASGFGDCTLRNCRFNRSKFVDLGFRRCVMEHCHFEDCEFAECRWGQPEDGGTAREVRMSGKMQNCYFWWDRAQNIDMTEVRCKGEVELALKSGANVKLPTGEECFFIRVSDHTKVLDALVGLSTASRVGLDNVFIRNSSTPDLMALDTSMLEGLPKADVNAVLQTARSFALGEFPFGG